MKRTVDVARQRLDDRIEALLGVDVPTDEVVRRHIDVSWKRASAEFWKCIRVVLGLALASGLSWSIASYFWVPDPNAWLICSGVMIEVGTAVAFITLAWGLVDDRALRRRTRHLGVLELKELAGLLESTPALRQVVAKWQVQDAPLREGHLELLRATASNVAAADAAWRIDHWVTADGRGSC